MKRKPCGDVFFASIFLLAPFSFDASKENEQKKDEN
jgi:hypothetical protein